MKTLAKSMPLTTEVWRRHKPATLTMPAYWELVYRDVVIWSRLHEPTESDVRDALQQHAARQQAGAA